MLRLHRLYGAYATNSRILEFCKERLTELQKDTGRAVLYAACEAIHFNSELLKWASVFNEVKREGISFTELAD